MNECFNFFFGVIKSYVVKSSKVSMFVLINCEEREIEKKNTKENSRLKGEEASKG